jgi:hypothetical protein
VVDDINIYFKYFYMKLAYEKATKFMDRKDGNRLTFTQCCQGVIRECASVGIDNIKRCESLMEWNRHFRDYEKLENPNRHEKQEFVPMLFKIFPDMKERIHEHLSKTLETLSTNYFHQYLLDELLPKLVEEHNSDIELNSTGEEPLTVEAVLKTANLKTLCRETAFKYLKSLGYKWSKHRKNYYNDGHEKEENVKARQTYIKRYLQYEIQSYRWVQITESVATDLENDEKQPLMSNISYNYVDENNMLMQEYHIDCHPEFMNYVQEDYKILGGNLSVFEKEIGSHL